MREIVDDDCSVNKEWHFFVDLHIGNTPIKDCALLYQGKHDNARLYARAEDGYFKAHAVEVVTSETDDSGLQWGDESTVVQTIFVATAYFDGVRHLEFNRNGGDMDGYLYYPKMVDLIAMLQKVRELEIGHCREAQ